MNNNTIYQIYCWTIGASGRTAAATVAAEAESTITTTH
ncbi:hypothetical protein PPL_01497 [Heterostelium album PN500]|uniref:Uncharacterized protein n=1 Tax=Heterostelium pallidum (strain ATCC 26659 / Pp 5 / PN500) TaxID=670386 RepID=D3AZF6_HETP5|nr:hypothetical protein PPL_01497 [Heterostelium album PN500]EFA85539.1 hypothetical protein PPL_01497 [Heterostelium album PN500]|eukprot:XP_020437647.1 hypothetical protein PPL_01497 [Heterostelium album PN500]